MSYEKSRLKSALHKFYGHYLELVDRYDMSLNDLTSVWYDMWLYLKWITSQS